MFRLDIIHSHARRLLSIMLTLTAMMGSLSYPYSVVSGKTPAKTLDQPAAAERMRQSYQLPLSFETNQGQTDGEVKFLSRGSGYTVFLTATEAVLSLQSGAKTKPAVLRMKLAGAQNNPTVTGRHELSGKVNYLTGQDRNQWQTNVSTYRQVYYEEVYSGIDLVYYGNQRQLEYDFIVKPHVNPETISLAFTGARSLKVDRTGDLVLETAAGVIRQKQPVAYQEIDGQRRTVPANYVVKNRRQVGFQLGAYDPSRPLVIDPIIDYSTYLGGAGLDEANDIAVDKDGNIYVTGVTSSVNFPPKDPIKPICQPCQFGAPEAFVTKINPGEEGDASLVFSTFWGSNVHGSTEGRAIAVDAEHNVYVVGTTGSINFPTTPNALQPVYQPFTSTNGFLTKFDPQGSSYQYSTYLMGNNVDEPSDVAVDADNNIYVAGATASTNFQLMNAYQTYNFGIFDGFLMKFQLQPSPGMPPHPGAYSLVYSTYFGGYTDDRATNLALDSIGNAYLMGTTQSRDLAWTPYWDGFPVKNGFQMNHGGGTDAFVMKIDPTQAGLPSLLYSSYLGGGNQENAAVQLGGIAVDRWGDAYVTGMTSSNLNFPIKEAYDSTISGVYDTFVTKVDPDLVGMSSLIYSTFLGGLGNDWAHDIAVDLDGRAVVVGATESPDFVPTGCGFPKGPSVDGFIVVLNSSGSGLDFMTYLGGNGADSINAIALDASGIAYVTGSTNSTDFKLERAFQGSLVNHKDAFVTKIRLVGCVATE
ncbi:MAG TPA: SBBP repeat-containing protein [Pyrinomonadaceae bacterium]|nr:SBBP repeat-containing protein [Pyrinomonadaceae bacterium]